MPLVSNASDLMELLKGIKRMKDQKKKLAIKEITLAEDLKNDGDLVAEAVKLVGYAIFLFSEKFKNNGEMVVAASKTNIGALGFAGDGIRSDPVAGKRLVEAVGTTAFQRLLLHARSDLELCFHVIAERKDPYQIQYCPIGVINNRAFVLKLIKQNGFVLNMLPPHYYADLELLAASFKQRKLVYADKAVKFVESDPSLLASLLELSPITLQAFPAVKLDPANLELVLKALEDGMEVWSNDPIFTLFPRNFRLWYLAVLGNPQCMAFPVSCYKREIGSEDDTVAREKIETTYSALFFKCVLAAPDSVNELPLKFKQDAEFMNAAACLNWELAFHARTHLSGEVMLSVFSQQDVNLKKLDIRRSDKMRMCTVEAKKIAKGHLAVYPSYLLFLKGTGSPAPLDGTQKCKRYEAPTALQRIGGHGFYFKAKFLKLVTGFAGAPSEVEFKVAEAALPVIEAAFTLVREAEKVDKERQVFEKYGIAGMKL